MSKHRNPRNERPATSSLRGFRERNSHKWRVDTSHTTPRQLGNASHLKTRRPFSDVKCLEKAHSPVKELRTVELPTRRATTRLGRWIAQSARAGDLVLLSGSLGTGKTFLARAIARAMGVPTEVRVTSPTFTIVHEFETTPKLIHADLYRIDDAVDVERLLLREARTEGAILVVEWGEPFLRELGGDALIVRLSLSEGTRFADIEVAVGAKTKSCTWNDVTIPTTDTLVSQRTMRQTPPHSHHLPTATPQPRHGQETYGTHHPAADRSTNPVAQHTTHPSNCRYTDPE